MQEKRKHLKRIKIRVSVLFQYLINIFIEKFIIMIKAENKLKVNILYQSVDDTALVEDSDENKTILNLTNILSNFELKINSKETNKIMK